MIDLEREKNYDHGKAGLEQGKLKGQIHSNQNWPCATVKSSFCAAAAIKANAKYKSGDTFFVYLCLEMRSMLWSEF